MSQLPLRSALVALALIACVSTIAPAQSLRMLDPNKKAHIEKAGSIPILYQNVGQSTITITNVAITQDFNTFLFDSTATFTRILAPGETGYFTIYFHAAIAYEYNCDIAITAVGPGVQILHQHLRVNDTIPPNKVRNLREYPLKGGRVRFEWDPPYPARDGDSIWHYEVYTGRFGDQYDTLLDITHATTSTVLPPGDGWMTFSVIAWDDGGNGAIIIDTGWTSRNPPELAVAHIDPASSNVPEHVPYGVVPLKILAHHNQLSYVRVSVKDTASGAPLHQLLDHWGPLWSVHEILSVDWTTLGGPSAQDIVVYARDSVGNDTTVTWRFQCTQMAGWPKFIPHAITQPSSSTITSDGTGPFVLMGSDIANGAFRPTGDLFYSWWPLNVTRPSADIVVTSTAEVDNTHPGLEELVGASNNHALLLSGEGRTLLDYGPLQEGSEVLAFDLASASTPRILIGPSPVVIDDAMGVHVAGANDYRKLDGNSLNFAPVFPLVGRYEFDRVVAGSLDRSGAQQFVRVHSAEGDSGEVLAVYDASGTLLPGWPRTLWMPSKSYVGCYPSLGDIDGDGKLEIVIPTPDDSLRVFRMNGSIEPGYPVAMNTHDAGHNQALIVDMDGDGAGDIILPAKDSIQCINGLRHQPMGGMWPIKRHALGTTLLTAADLDGDGFIELIESPQVSDTGSWAFVYRTPAKLNATTIQWGTFQHDMQRSGNYDVGKVSLAVAPADGSLAATECQVFPQPTRGGISVRLSDENAREWTRVDIRDMLGRLCLTAMHDHAGSIEPELDLSKLPVGAYLLEVSTPSRIIRSKLSVVR